MTHYKLILMKTAAHGFFPWLNFSTTMETFLIQCFRLSESVYRVRDVGGGRDRRPSFLGVLCPI